MSAPAPRRLTRLHYFIIVLMMVCCGLPLSRTAYQWVTRPRYTELTATVVMDESAFPPGQYMSAAWISDTVMAFVYLPQEVYDRDPSPGFWNYQLILFDIGARRLVPGPQPPHEDCYSAWALIITRLPNGNLGFLDECNSTVSSADGSTLYEWDLAAGALHQLQFYPAAFHASHFSFAPDMSELMQGSKLQPWLSGLLYRVRANGEMEQLLVGWKRVAQPRWSPDGQSIVFIGTRDYAPGSPDNMVEVQALAYTPWTLYRMDARGGEPEPLLDNLQYTWVKWLPRGNMVAFGGEYGSEGGIWVLKVETGAVVRIWPESSTISFSPDGAQAVILRRTETDDDVVQQPIIVDVSPGLYALPAP